MTPKFRPGDKVRYVETFHPAGGREEFYGTILTISSCDRSVCTAEEYNWLFVDRWLELIEEEVLTDRDFEI